MTAPTPRETADHAERSPSIVTGAESDVPSGVSLDHAELAACPFCGGTATIEQFGNTRATTIYQCDECVCRLETGEEFHHGREWNRRPREAALLSEIAALRGERDGLKRAETVAVHLADTMGDRATQAERQRDELRKALDDLSSVIAWLANGCEPQHAVTELGIYKARIDQALANQGADQ